MDQLEAHKNADPNDFSKDSEFLEICENTPAINKNHLSETSPEKLTTQEIVDCVLPPQEHLSEENLQLATDILSSPQETREPKETDIISLPGGTKVDISEIPSLDLFFDFDRAPNLSEQKNPYWKAEFIKRNWNHFKDQIKIVKEPSQLDNSKPETDRGRTKPTHAPRPKQITNATLGALNAGPSLENFWKEQNLPRIKKKTGHPLAKLAARKSATPRSGPINLSELWGSTDTSEIAYQRMLSNSLKKKKKKEKAKRQAEIQEFSDSDSNESSNENESLSSPGSQQKAQPSEIVPTESTQLPQAKTPEPLETQNAPVSSNQNASVLTTPNLQQEESDDDQLTAGQKIFEYRNNLINGMIETLALKARGTVEIPDEIISAFRKNVDYIFGSVITQPPAACRCAHIEQKMVGINEKLDTLLSRPVGVSEITIERLTRQCETLTTTVNEHFTALKTNPHTTPQTTPQAKSNSAELSDASIPSLETVPTQEISSHANVSPSLKLTLKQWVSERVSLSESKLKELSSDCKHELKLAMSRLSEDSIFKTTRYPLCYMQPDTICNKNFIPSAYRCLHEDLLIFLQDYERVNLEQPNLLQTSLGKAVKKLITDRDMKPRMRVIGRVQNILLNTRLLNAKLMFPTLLSKTELICLLSNMNYHANFLYNAIGIDAEQAKFTTATGDLIDKLMEDENVTFRTLFNMLRDIIPSDLRMDPGYKPQQNGEPWFFDDFISSDIQTKNQFRQVDRNRFGCLDSKPPVETPEPTAELERLPSKQASKTEATRTNLATGTTSKASAIDNYEIDHRNEQNSLNSSQDFLDYADRMSPISSIGQEEEDQENHGDLYDGFPPEFM